MIPTTCGFATHGRNYTIPTSPPEGIAGLPMLAEKLPLYVRGMSLANGVLASGWDKGPLSYMIYSALFMPPFREGGMQCCLNDNEIYEVSKPIQIYNPSAGPKFIEKECKIC